MKLIRQATLLLAAGLALGLLSRAQAEDLVPLKLDLPKPMFVGTPVRISRLRERVAGRISWCQRGS